MSLDGVLIERDDASAEATLSIEELRLDEERDGLGEDAVVPTSDRTKVSPSRA